MRQFIYGLILGAFCMFVWEKGDIPGWWAWLIDQRDWAVETSH